MNFTEETCPECGSDDKVELNRAEHPDSRGHTAVLYQCKECGCAWDAFLP